MKFSLAIYYLNSVIKQLEVERKKYSREDKEKISGWIKQLRRSIIELRNHEK